MKATAAASGDRDLHQPGASGNLCAPWAVNPSSRGRLVGGTPEAAIDARLSLPTTSPRIPSPEPNPASLRTPPAPPQHPTRFLSGRQDLNLRPPGPQPGALPDCATPRGKHKRATGIEPALEAWKASVQPQHFARTALCHLTGERARARPARRAARHGRAPPVRAAQAQLPAARPPLPASPLLHRHLARLVRQPRRRPRPEPVVARPVQRHRRAAERAPERARQAARRARRARAADRAAAAARSRDAPARTLAGYFASTSVSKCPGCHRRHRHARRAPSAAPARASAPRRSRAQRPSAPCPACRGAARASR